MQKDILHYLGKAEGFNGINGRLVSTHDKFSELKNDVTHIGIHICQQEENPKDIESMLLNHYKFTYNIQENQPDVDLPTNVAED